MPGENIDKTNDERYDRWKVSAAGVYINITQTGTYEPLDHPRQLLKNERLL